MAQSKGSFDRDFCRYRGACVVAYGRGVADRNLEGMDAYTRLKTQLVGRLSGRVLELGAGRGSNFALLGPDVAWVGIEPAGKRRRQLAREGHQVLAATAEALPLGDGSVDAVLATIVLCSVRDQDTALAEAARVLRPGGRFVFFEHVAAPPGTWFRRWQQASAPVNRVIDHGCDPARETWRALERAPFRELEVRWYARGRTPYIGGYAVA